MSPEVKQFDLIARCWMGEGLNPDLIEGQEVGIKKWVNLFWSQIDNSRLGYPTCGPVMAKPEYEFSALKILENFKLKGCPIHTKPILVLSHDVDYWRPTVVQAAKEIIGRGKWRRYFSAPSYFECFRRLLEMDRQYLPNGTGPSVFFAAGQKAKSKARQIKQMLFDPGYSWSSDEARVWVRLMEEFACDVGIHGSLFSLDGGLLGAELGILERAFGRSIQSSRQHWLNLPSGRRSMAVLRELGIRVDSTVGWNGHIGFRGGVSRPIPVLLPNGMDWILEVPLVAMDGVLFDEYKLSEDDGFTRLTALLGEVKDVCGAVAINWHERSGHVGYGWDGLYQRVLEWCSGQGFQFMNISQVGRLYGSINETGA